MRDGGIYVNEELLDKIRSLGNTVAKAEEGMKAFQDYTRAGFSSLTFDSPQIQMIEDAYNDINNFIHARHQEMRKSMQRVLPITIEVNGEKKIVGNALIETDATGDHIMHAVIDADDEVTKLLSVGLNQISIGRRSDFRRET